MSDPHRLHRTSFFGPRFREEVDCSLGSVSILSGRSVGLIPMLAWVAVSVMVVVGGVGCSGASHVRDASNFPVERARDSNLSAEGYDVVQVDINGDGKPDQFSFFENGKLLRVEKDLNFDGKTNLWAYYDATGATLIEEELDLDFDGEVDVVNYYVKGKLDRKAISTGFSNSFDINKVFAGNGTLLRIERDTDGDGVANLIDYYENSKRVRTGVDLDGDGLPDTFDEIAP